jgi:hypothetical protein
MLKRTASANLATKAMEQALNGRAVDEPDLGTLGCGVRLGDRGGLATESFSTTM